MINLLKHYDTTWMQLVIELVREVVVECLDAGGLWNIDDLDFCVECRHNTQMPALAEQQFLIAYDQLLQ